MIKLSLYTTLGVFAFAMPVLSEEQCGQVCDMDYWRSVTDQAALLGELERLPNVNARHQYGWTAIAVAASFGNLEAVQLLIERGANVNISDNWNNTALFAAVRSGDTSAVEALLDAGADILHIGSEGLNSAEFASQQGEYEIAELLNRAIAGTREEFTPQIFQANASRLDAANRFEADWLTWWDTGWSRTYFGWCHAMADDETIWWGVTHNTYASRETENARAGCIHAINVTNRMLGDRISDRTWMQGNLWGNYSATHDVHASNPAVRFDFLQYGDDENFALWLEEAIDNDEDLGALEAVAIRRILNRPGAGTYSYTGHVGFGGLGHRENVSFATVNFENNTVVVDANFIGFRQSVTFGEERYSIFSGPLTLYESGYFGGDLVGTHQDVAGRFSNYRGYIHGYVGGDGGNLVVALYAMQWGGPSDFLIGSAR